MRHSRMPSQAVAASLLTVVEPRCCQKTDRLAHFHLATANRHLPSDTGDLEKVNPCERSSERRFPHEAFG